MKTAAHLAVLSLVVLAAAPARAHFKLTQPADWLQTNANGDPLGTGGTQKMNPCGQGTPSGLVTQVQAGSVLHIKLTETVPHGGHYRVGLVPKWGLVTSDVPEPAVTLNAGQCDSAAVESPVVAPVIADDLFPHTQAEATAGKVWETDVQLPNEPGKATLQILEFMAPHAPECFYHHCAQLELLAPDAGAAASDGGVVVVGPDGGVVTMDAGGDTSGGGNAGAGGATASPAASDGSSGGCSVGGSATPSVVTLGWLGIAAASLLRRRRRARGLSAAR